jgi:hypothetical protein
VISRTTRSFWKLFDRLPEEVRRRAADAYALWSTNPDHPGLQFKCVNERAALFSARVGLSWRAICTRRIVDGEVVYSWFWIGSHSDYDNMIRSTPTSTTKE